MARAATGQLDISRWVSERLAAAGRDPAADRALAVDGINVDTKSLEHLAPAAARQASGFYRPTRRTEVVWVEGDSELEVRFADVKVSTGRGTILVIIPVRCDQTGAESVRVPLAVGSGDLPAGVYAAASRRPLGPEVIVDVWGDALVAFAWDVVLTLVIEVAGSLGKDRTGSRLVPGELVATREGLTVVPMERHRFFGSSGLLQEPGER